MSQQNKRIIAFGEIMLRLCPPNFQRFVQARSFNATYGGGEANVAISLANYGMDVEYVTRLPNNDVGRACHRFLREHKVGTEHILWGTERLGVYFLEQGAVSRSSKVIYDRANSSLASIKPGMVNWKQVFQGASWLHWTGITPAISKGAAAVCLEAVETAKEQGLTISCDLNYRKKLWKWGKPPSEVMTQLVQHCDIVIGNEEDAAKVFNVAAPNTDVTSGEVDARKYQEVCESLNSRFSNVRLIAITLRGSISASRNTWSGLLWQDGQMYVAPVYDITHIVDRVGGGDAFAGGLIYGLHVFPNNVQQALNFAVSASCLKHTIVGDCNLATVEEVEKLMAGNASGRVSR